MAADRNSAILRPFRSDRGSSDHITSACCGPPPAGQPSQRSRVRSRRRRQKSGRAPGRCIADRYPARYQPLKRRLLLLWFDLQFAPRMKNGVSKSSIACRRRSNAGGHGTTWRRPLRLLVGQIFTSRKKWRRGFACRRVRQGAPGSAQFHSLILSLAADISSFGMYGRRCDQDASDRV